MGLTLISVVLIVVGNIAGWWVFISGYLLIILSLLVFGVASLRSGVLPWWASTLLILTPICLFLFNTEDNRAWLMVPVGAAWVVLGYILWSRKYEAQRPLGGS